jgi:S1-C subfamily serine protease
MNKFIALFALLLTPVAFSQSLPGNFGKSSISVPNISPSKVAISSEISGVSALNEDTFPLAASFKASSALVPDNGVNSRGVRDAALFKNISPSVVLIVTKDGLGSGSLIGKQGEILTNWHVVGNVPEVGVILKPAKDVQAISKGDIRRARVIKIDQVADLALIQLIDTPVGRPPIKLGDDSDISVGADVHAIGHPNGEAWTYTKGIISQYRNDYLWSQGPNSIKHKAPVIQTQTPINPGNSGGPLLTDNGNLVGVNSFKEPKSEGMNFAVSVEEVKKFLSSKSSRIADLPKLPPAAKQAKCEMKEIYRGKTSDGTGETIVWDSSCKGKADLDVIVPYDKKEPMIMRMDRNGDGKPDVLLFSEKRDNKWDISFWDENYDGNWDLVGFHKNGEIKPFRYDDYSTVTARK